MPNPLRHAGPGVAMAGFEGSSSAGSGTEWELHTPLEDWSLQVVSASTDLIVTLDFSLQSSSGAAFEAKLTWATTAGQATGNIVSVTGVPARQVRATLVAGGSSNGSSAWFAGV